MGIAFITPNSKMPGLNFDAPPDVRSLEYLFDQVFAGEQRSRLQLLMGQYRDAGPSYGIVDQLNPNSAVIAGGRPLTVQPNAGDLLTLDITPGMAVTKSGNIIVIPEQLYGINLANNAVTSVVSTVTQGTENVVLLEYLVVDDATTNVVTDFNTVEAVRRVVALPIDPALPQSTPESAADPDLNKQQMVKVVTISDFLDLSKFSIQRRNEVVVLAIVKVVPNSDVTTLGAQPIVLNIDMTNAVNTYVRPWFSAVDQEHRAFVGTGVSTVPHSLSYNDLGGGALTLYQQVLPHGIVISRDLNVPGHPGKFCSEFVDGTNGVRIMTDTDGSVTGTVNRRYVRLNSYPTRLIGIRANKADGLNSVEDKSVSAQTYVGELIPNTNILALSVAGEDSWNTTLGFTVYYTDSDCLRPPALPHDIMLTAGDILQFQSPTATEEYITGGKIYETVPTTQFAVGTNGPIPKNYRLWLDASKQFVEGPQVVSCAKLINEASGGVGTAVQTPQFPMYGPARIRVALWNAPAAVSSMLVEVELVGKDLNGATITEVLVFSGTSGVAAPRQVAWDQTTFANGEAVNCMQVSTNVFRSLDTWKVKPTLVGAGANALLQLWADVGPTVTPALDDALPICLFTWNGQSVTRIRDIRPISRLLQTARSNLTEFSPNNLVFNALNTQFASESFRDPTMQDFILSRRDRHSRDLDTVMTDETLLGFSVDGTHPGREWYYSQAVAIPTGRTTTYIQLFGDELTSFDTSGGFGAQFVVECQIAPSGGSFGSWTAMTAYGSDPRIRSIPTPGGTFKARFRIAGRHLSGFTLIA